MRKGDDGPDRVRQVSFGFIHQEDRPQDRWVHHQDSIDAFEGSGSLEDLREEVLACDRCHLRSGCRQVVFGEGDSYSPLVFIGEAPGADEDRTGRPFVGRAGQLLNRILEACDLDRESVYITNIVKCRPPDNRTPTPAERETCLPYLKEQVKLIRPRVIVALGAAAMQGLIASREGITRMRGKWQQWQGVRVMPTFHPAALLRDPRKKEPTWHDMQLVMKELEGEG